MLQQRVQARREKQVAEPARDAMEREAEGRVDEEPRGIRGDGDEREADGDQADEPEEGAHEPHLK
jgi:hypothetical protein